MTRQQFVAVRTAPGDIQLTVHGGAVEMSDAEAIDLALSLLASADPHAIQREDSSLRVNIGDFETWANQTQTWLNAQPGEFEKFANYHERREAVAPPPDPW